MRKALTVVLAGSLLLVLASCGNSNQRSLVRFVNASPDAVTMDVTINGNKVLSGEAYGSGSNYFTVAPGTNIDLKIDTTGTNPLHFDTKIGLVDKSYYTIAATGLVGDPNHLPLPIPSTFTIVQAADDHSAPAATAVKIRVLQLDPIFHVTPGDSGAVDAYVTAPAAILNPPSSTPTFPSLTFQSTPSFVSVTVPSDGNLRIRVAPAGDTDPDNTNLPGWDSQTVNFTAGQIRTYVLLNNPAGTPFPNQSVMLKDLN